MTRDIGLILTYKKNCQRCFEKAVLTDWRPEPGLDPDLRQYKCPHCGDIRYYPIPGSRHRDLEGFIREEEKKQRGKRR